MVRLSALDRENWILDGSLTLVGEPQVSPAAVSRLKMMCYFVDGRVKVTVVFFTFVFWDRRVGSETHSASNGKRGKIVGWSK